MHRAIRLLLNVSGNGIWVRIHKTKRFLIVQLDTTQKFAIQVAPVGADDNPGRIDGPPTYPIDNNGILTITVAADGLSCICAGASAGTCTITPTAVANGVTITGTPVDVTVTLPPEQFAAKLNVTAGPVVAQ